MLKKLIPFVLCLLLLPTVISYAQQPNDECVIPPSGPWPPCATGGAPSTPTTPSNPSNDECIIPTSGPWPPCATGGAPSTPTPPSNPSNDECVIPPSGPWPPCATSGTSSTPTPPSDPSNDECVIPTSGPWPPCATGGTPVTSPPPPPSNDECIIPPSGPWPPCATGGQSTQPAPPSNSGDVGTGEPQIVFFRSTMSAGDPRWTQNQLIEWEIANAPNDTVEIIEVLVQTDIVTQPQTSKTLEQMPAKGSLRKQLSSGEVVSYIFRTQDGNDIPCADNIACNLQVEFTCTADNPWFFVPADAGELPARCPQNGNVFKAIQQEYENGFTLITFRHLNREDVKHVWKNHVPMEARTRPEVTFGAPIGSPIAFDSTMQSAVLSQDESLQTCGAWYESVEALQMVGDFVLLHRFFCTGHQTGFTNELVPITGNHPFYPRQGTPTPTNHTAETPPPPYGSVVCDHPATLADQGEGCPHPSLTTTMSLQEFEQGYMIWVDQENIDSIFVVPKQTGGETVRGDIHLETSGWGRFPDFSQRDNAQTYTPMTPPAGKFTPEDGFGYLWHTKPRVRAVLGWGLAQPVNYTGQQQQWDLSDYAVEGLCPQKQRRSDTYVQMPTGQVVQYQIESSLLDVLDCGDVHILVSGTIQITSQYDTPAPLDWYQPVNP